MASPWTIVLLAQVVAVGMICAFVAGYAFRPGGAAFQGELNELAQRLGRLFWVAWKKARRRDVLRLAGLALQRLEAQRRAAIEKALGATSEDLRLGEEAAPALDDFVRQVAAGMAQEESLEERRERREVEGDAERRGEQLGPQGEYV
jgi:hypothetical protein